MKKRLLSLLCVLALVLSLLPTTALAETSDFTLELEVNATVGETTQARNLNELRAGDMVTAKIKLPSGTYSSVQVALGFDRGCFEIATISNAEYTFTPAYEAVYNEEGIYVSHTDGWGQRVNSTKTEANQNGYFSVGAVGQTYDTEKSSAVVGNVGTKSDMTILTVKFRVKNCGPKNATPFSVLGDSERLSICRIPDGQVEERAYTVGLPAPVSATVVQELGNVTLSGSVTAPAKNVTDTSALTEIGRAHV